jgi:hypothetical protein
MDSAAQLQSVDRATLIGPVRRALRSDTVQVLDWRSSRLGGGVGNPVSLGLYRFSGTGQDRGEIVTWSLVLKIAQSPANVGAQDMGEGEDQTHWNYWKREMHIYRSGLLEDLPRGLAAPRCFGIEERPGDVFWLWLEEITGSDHASWPLDRYGLAARHFGRFNGAYLSKRSLRTLPWLSIGLLRQWCIGMAAELSLFFDFRRRPSMWEHPLVRRIYPPPNANPFMRFLMERERFLAALDQLPQTLCHKDAYSTNLIARRGEDGQEETVALDWALAGIGPVGEELAQIAIGALDNVEAAESARVNQVVFDGYLDGLRDSGWRGDVQTVRFGYVASAVFRIGLWLLWELGAAFEESQSVEPQETQRDPVEEIIEQQAATTRFVLDLAEEAYGLLDAME